MVKNSHLWRVVPRGESLVGLSFLLGLVGRLEAFWVVFLVSLFFLNKAVMFFGILVYFALVGVT